MTWFLVSMSINDANSQNSQFNKNKDIKKKEKKRRRKKARDTKKSIYNLPYDKLWQNL